MKILLSCGRTGGHIKNAINLANYLENEKKNIKIEFILPCESMFKKTLKAKNYTYHLLPVKITPSALSLKWFVFFIKLLQSFIQSVIIINRVKPDVIIGFGSYASLPVVLASKLTRHKAKIILHEQNVRPGRANLFLARFADRIAVGFKPAREFFKKKAIFCGNIINPDVKKINPAEARNYFGLKKDEFVLLIAGGSQGSAFLNGLAIELARHLRQENEFKIKVIHQTGEEKLKSVNNRYRNIDFSVVKTYGFLDKMEEAMCASDLIISRAGAMTLSEAITLGKPAVLIPYPYARSHQRENAEYLREKGAALVFYQKDFEFRRFKKELFNLIHHKDRLERLSKEAERMTSVDAAGKMKDLIFGVI